MAQCGIGVPGVGWLCDNTVGKTIDAVTSSASDIASEALNALAKSILDGATEMLRTLSSLWVQIPSETTDSPASWLSGSLVELTGAVAVASLLIAFAKVALSGRGEHANRAIGGLVRLIAVNGAGAALVVLGLNWGDQFSKWILDAATANDPSSHINGISAAITVAFAATFVQMLLGILALIGTIIQIALMFLRIPMLVVVAGLWPLAAASSATETGLQWYRKLTGWLIALVLYKPVAAIVYAAAFHMMQPTNDPTTVLGGIALTVIAVIALPALMRFFVPMVSAVGGGSGAGAVAANMATGAVAVGVAAATLGAGSAATGSAGLASTSTKSPSGAGESGGSKGGPSGGGSGPSGSGGGNNGSGGPGGSNGNGSQSTENVKDAFAAAHSASGAMQAGKNIASADGALLPDEEMEAKK